jgi:hypothetical protein
MLFHFLVEGRGPKPFMQVVVVDAASDVGARAAVTRYLIAEGATLVGYDEEETAVIDAGAIPSSWPRPANDFGVVAVSGRVWCDRGPATGS